MKISYSWLKEHLPLDLSSGDLAAHFGLLGFEVASLDRRGPAFSGVVGASVLEVGKHPNADRLSVCKVTDGTTTFSVVCGAKNVAAGQKVALARVGAKLPGGVTITPAKLRGVESQGMICSARELGLGDSHDGIMVLDAATALGVDLASTMGSPDEVFDLEITPNRPDCLSHLGVARELAAYFRLSLKKPAAPALPAPEGTTLPVSIEAPMACPLYVGRVLTGLSVRQSPPWLASRLEAVGLRPINALVDVTNYILFDMGQPLHVFDLAKLKDRVVVRSAAAGERLKALDGKEYALTPEVLVIADARGPVAAAGVMGGLETGVTDKTTSVFLESAHFAPNVVRRGSQVLRLRSDSSYRFERGTDIAAVGPASERAAALILQLCWPAGKAAAPVSAAGKARELRPITVSAARIDEVLGSSFPEPAVAGVLKGIGEGLDAAGGTYRFMPPTWRWDLETPWDLAEEVARHLGYDNIKPRIPAVALKPSRPLPSEVLAERCRRRLVGLGLCEAYNYDFVSEKALAQARLPDQNRLRLANPLSEDWVVLRPSLLPGLLENARQNLNRGARGLRLFELGRVYSRAEDGPDESTRLAGLMLGPSAEAFWQAARCPESGFYDLKGVVSELLSGVPGVEWVASGRDGQPQVSDPLFAPGGALKLVTARGVVGTVGLLHPQAARAWDLDRQPVGLFDLALDLLFDVAPTHVQFVPYSTFPTSWRDLSIVLDRKAAYASVEEAVRGLGLAELKTLELVDVFEGKGIPEGKRSLTLRLTFSRDDRTMTDAEVTALMDRILKTLSSGLGAVLRS